MINIKHDFDRLEKRFANVSKQIPFATARTLTILGKQAKEGLSGEIRGVFDRPTPYIKNSPFSTSAKKTDLRVTIGIRDQSGSGRAAPSQYIKEFFGGSSRRGLKPYERAMASILPTGLRAVPATGMKLDAFGNPNRTQLREVLGALKSKTGIYAGKGKRQSLQAYFIVRDGEKGTRAAHLHAGIWRRIKRGADSVIIPVFLFVSSADYQKAIDLPLIAEKVINRNLKRVFKAELERALRTAR